MRPFLRRQNALSQAHVGQRPHLAQALQGRFARVGLRRLIALRGHIAERQPGVVVGGADQTIEIGFDRAHRLSPGANCSGKLLRSASMLATG